ncbi:hypothetical protein BOX15_Mlig029047g1, partial [Macrostomum lignano]
KEVPLDIGKMHNSVIFSLLLFVLIAASLARVSVSFTANVDDDFVDDNELSAVARTAADQDELDQERQEAMINAIAERDQLQEADSPPSKKWYWRKTYNRNRH